MTRGLWRIVGLAVALAACGSVTSAPTDGGAGTGGGAGTKGSAGTSGGAGTTGGGGTSAAGTNGAAGTAAAAGTNGAAGTAAAAGTNGAAGTRATAGTNGAAGTTAHQPMAVLKISPERFDFGDVKVGDESLPASFIISNAGDAPTGALAINLGGPDLAQFQAIALAGGCSTNPLGPGASCSVGVKLKPTSRLAKMAVLQVTASPGGGAQSTLLGKGLGPQLVWKPDTLDFGPIPVGKATAEMRSTLSNSGELATGALGFTTVSGVNDFFISYGTCGATLAPGASCEEVFQGSPNAVGVRTAVLDAHATGVQAKITLVVTGVP